jgi:hypothetical protein
MYMYIYITIRVNYMDTMPKRNTAFLSQFAPYCIYIHYSKPTLGFALDMVNDLSPSVRPSVTPERSEIGDNLTDTSSNDVSIARTDPPFFARSAKNRFLSYVHCGTKVGFGLA